MKFLIVFTLLIAAVCAFRGYSHNNGRPGCSTTEEATKKIWRNNFDPTKYWECATANSAGEERFCHSEFLFQPDLNKCVHYLEWEWTPLEDPPSFAP